MSTIRIDVRNIAQVKYAFEEAPRRMKEELKKALALSGALAQRTEKEEVPIDRGYLRGSVDVRQDSGSVVIWPRANYALAVHEGTGVYGPKHQRIYPTKAKVLAWKSGGKTIFARSTAGQRPNRFATRTKNLIHMQVVSYFAEAALNALKGK